LVRAARGGDRQALEDLLRRHHDRLHALCRRLTGNDADALDATQEALIAVVRGIDRFDERSSFKTWAYRVATNAALDELRRRRRRPEPGLPVAALTSPGTDASLDQGVANRLDVDAALARLPTEFRAPVVLRDLCTLSYDEIAVVLEIPPGTVRSRIARGRAALADILRDDEVQGPAGPEGHRQGLAGPESHKQRPGNPSGLADRPNPAHE
jgi:RNA polymerase sigma-70 factor (ECF subfamily)